MIFRFQLKIKSRLKHHAKKPPQGREDSVTNHYQPGFLPLLGNSGNLSFPGAAATRLST